MLTNDVSYKFMYSYIGNLCV